jgi:PIN domain nuclease of toxin-antitoxin system
LRLLLDTHALVWWGADDPKLGPNAAAALRDADNEVFVSAVTAMEIATKVRLGKWPSAAWLLADLEKQISDYGFQMLSVSVTHARIGGSMRIAHKDPFDRLLIAQSVVEDLALVTVESAFEAFGVTRVW